MNDVVKALMERDGMSKKEAIALYNKAISSLRKKVAKGEFVDDSDFCQKWFGLEPDYFIDILLSL